MRDYIIATVFFSLGVGITYLYEWISAIRKADREERLKPLQPKYVKPKNAL